MKEIKWIALGVGAFLVYNFFRFKQTLQLLRFSLAGINYVAAQSGALQTTLTITMAVANPTSYTISVAQFTGALRVRGSLITTFYTDGNGQGVNFTPGWSYVPVTVTINHLQLAAEVLNIVIGMGKGTLNEPLEVFASVTKYGIYIPLSTTLNLTNNSLGAVSGCGCRVGEVSGAYALN